MSKNEPPIFVIKGLDEWLYSAKAKAGFSLVKEIILEEGLEGTHASEGCLFIGEEIFKKGSHFYLSALNHEFEHLLDSNISSAHFRLLLSTMYPDEIKDILSHNRAELLYQHYEKVLDSTAELLKNDNKFKNLLMEIERRTKDLELSEAIKTFLKRETNISSLGGLGHVLSHKKEKQTVDDYLKRNYGIPNLLAFTSRPYNLRKVDSRLAELNGNPRLMIYPELSAAFAEITLDEKAEIYHHGTDIARKNIETLLQIAYDAGKIEESEFVEITNRVPIRGEIYNGPIILSQSAELASCL